MKLTLKNFKCHRNKEIEIPDEGLISLSGDSGAGKSTILVALCYALFGKIKGKVRKPYSHGTKSASVKVEMPVFGLTVFRSSSPTRLLVTFKDQEYEDEAAQEVIETTLGLNYDTFTASSYVVQNQESSVLTMTPTEQFNFIQKIAFDSVDEVENTKTKIKETISFLKKDTEKREYSAKYIREQYTRAKDLMPPKRSNPLNIEPTTLQEEIDELEEQLEHTNKKIADNRRNLDTIRQIEYENTKLERDAENLREFLKTNTVDDLKNKLLELEIKLEDDLILMKSYEVISNFQSEKKKVQDEYERFISTAATHSDTQEKEKKKLKKHLDILNPDETFRKLDDSKKNFERILNISSIENKKKETLASIQKIREFCLMCSPESTFETNSTFELDSSRKVEEEITRLLNDNKSLLKMKTEKSLECPCCESKLMIIDNELQLVDGIHEFVNENIVRDSIKILNDQLKLLQSLMRSEVHINEELASLGVDSNKYTCGEVEIAAAHKSYEENLEVWTKCTLIQQKLKDLENGSSSQAIFDTLKSNILKELEDFKKREQQNPELSEDVSKKRTDLNTSILNTNRDITDLKVKLADCERGSRKLTAIVTELERRKGEYKTSKEYEEKDKKYSETLTGIVALIRDKRKLIESSKEYIAYQKAKDHLEMLEQNLETEEYSINENKYNIEGYCALEKMCKDAEIIALERTIDTINIHAQHYIEQMFTDPIVVKLVTSRNAPSSGASSTKFQISTYIEYKGAVYDNVDELSGGERQRCELAYLLALNDVLGSKIILLDECLNNLDATINTDVLTFLRERCSEKMIVVISHEAVKGVFDHEIFV